MSDWSLEDIDLKRYPHFDRCISAKEAVALATDPVRVAAHPFYPLILKTQHWTRFAKKGEKGKVKDRPIRYAARGDAYIFSYYRAVLAEKYEAALKANHLEESVIAYRKIPVAEGYGGKCNIHFAKDAFSAVAALGNCCAIALDISNYFECLDHQQLKSLWCRLLSVSKLPLDHFRVFRAITNYSVVDKISAYEKLGHFGIKRKSKSGLPIFGYLTSYKEMPKQLCIGKQFQEVIAGGNGGKSLIITNYKPYGIPQGTPISDLLANVYLLDFDCTVSAW